MTVDNVQGTSTEDVIYLIEVLFGGLAIIFLIVGILSIFFGILLLNFKKAGRTGTIAIGAISLISFPLGTLFGLVALYYLTRPETAQLFS